MRENKTQDECRADFERILARRLAILELLVSSGPRDQPPVWNRVFAQARACFKACGFDMEVWKSESEAVNSKCVDPILFPELFETQIVLLQHAITDIDAATPCEGDPDLPPRWWESMTELDNYLRNLKQPVESGA